MLPHRSTLSSFWERPTSKDHEQHICCSERLRDNRATTANNTSFADTWIPYPIYSAQSTKRSKKPCCDWASSLSRPKGKIPATSVAQAPPESTSRPPRSSESDAEVLAADFEICRQSLRITFTRCQGRNFSYACFAISCVLNSQRRLRATELSIATTLLFEQYNILDTGSTDKDTDTSSWLDDCEAILSEDSSGMVRFSVNAMPAFISAFRIRGIDASHRSIAMACLVQHELDQDIQPETKGIGRAGSAFSNYAAQYWQYHREKAEQSGLWVSSKPLGSRAVAKHTDEICVIEQVDRGKEVADSCPGNDSLSIHDEWVVV